LSTYKKPSVTQPLIVTSPNWLKSALSNTPSHAFNKGIYKCLNLISDTFNNGLMLHFLKQLLAYYKGKIILVEDGALSWQ
jgi:hypothetical protein